MVDIFYSCTLLLPCRSQMAIESRLLRRVYLHHRNLLQHLVVKLLGHVGWQSLTSLQNHFIGWNCSWVLLQWQRTWGSSIYLSVWTFFFELRKRVVCHFIKIEKDTMNRVYFISLNYESLIKGSTLSSLYMVLIESIFHPSFYLGSIFWYDANAFCQFRYLLFVFFYLQAIVRLRELLLMKVTLRERKLEDSWKMSELHPRRFVVTM